MLTRTGLVLCTLMAVALLASPASAQGKLTFEKTEHNFGTIKEGEKPRYAFRFTNTGDQPVTISAVRPSCGCTAPSWPDQAIAPGAGGEIVLEYDSSGRPGEFRRGTTVMASDADPIITMLYIEGNVLNDEIVLGA
jgi:hypothetical protein